MPYQDYFDDGEIYIIKEKEFMFRKDKEETFKT